MKPNREAEKTEVVEPLGVQKVKRKRVDLTKKALLLVAKLKQKTDQQKRKCNHPNHPSYFVNTHGQCHKAWKCPDYGSEGCIATAVR